MIPLDLLGRAHVPLAEKLCRRCRGWVGGWDSRVRCQAGFVRRMRLELRPDHTGLGENQGEDGDLPGIGIESSSPASARGNSMHSSPAFAFLYAG